MSYRILIKRFVSLGGNYMNKNFLLTYQEDGSFDFAWFTTENDLQKFVTDGKKRTNTFKIESAIELLSIRDLGL